jgi:two-component system, LytTR family, response regulator
MSLRCIIIDDEPNAVQLLEMLITQSTSWEIVGKCYNGIEALACLRQKTADFIFLDINMPQLSGMELAGLLPTNTKIVFTTAYSEFAAESYSYDTIDYLLKPITLKRFLAAAQKIEAHFSKPASGVAVETIPTADYFFVKSGKTISKVLLDDILFFEGEKEYVRLVTVGEQILVYRRMKDIESQLGAPFIRVHNSFIINTRQLDKVSDNQVYIGSRQIPVGEKFREAFMEVINKRKF